MRMIYGRVSCALLIRGLVRNVRYRPSLLRDARGASAAIDMREIDDLCGEEGHAFVDSTVDP